MAAVTLISASGGSLAGAGPENCASSMALKKRGECQSVVNFNQALGGPSVDSADHVTIIAGTPLDEAWVGTSLARTSA